jgi:hypothetical protein
LDPRLDHQVRFERLTPLRSATAYFDESLERVFGGVDRHAFESRLMAQFETEDFRAAGDCAWYALKNTIYASGCRVKAAKSPSPPASKQARQRAYSYFENALSVHTELTYARNGIAAVQALLIMVRLSPQFMTWSEVLTKMVAGLLC